MIIELVGKAFDGHELTQGLAAHERYKIMWSEVPFVKDRLTLQKYGTTSRIVDSGEYIGQRQERSKFLIGCCHYDRNAVGRSLPSRYSILPDYIISNLLDGIVFEAYRKKQWLIERGFRVIGAQGNIVDGEPQVWEAYLPERWSRK